jgi:hypothetical protein
MLKIPFVTWIANAAAMLNGTYGDVTIQAEIADCSRETIYDHASKVQAAVVDQFPSPMEPDEVRDGNLLYVGLTRAIDHLAVTWTGRSAFTDRILRASKAEALPG